MAIYQVETDKGTYQVETEDTPEMTLGGLGKNAVSDAIQTGVGTATNPAIDLVGGNPIPMAKAAFQQGKEMLAHPKETAEAIVEPVTHPIKYGYEHPVQQAMNVASVAAPIVAPAAETVAKYAGRMGENQMGKLHGASRSQFQQLGRENFGDAMRTSFERGDADFTTGSIGREQAVKERIAQLGNDIGDVRDMASEPAPSGPVQFNMTGKDMADAIRAKIGSDYAPGGPKFADAAQFEAQLKNIEAMKSTTPKDFAQRATDINTEARGQKLLRSTGADTDVADQMSHINDEQIAKRLPPEIVEHYQTLKEEFGNTKPLDPMELRGEAKEATSKATSGTVLGMVKGAIHTAVGGPKMGAHVGFGAEAALQSLAKNGAGMGVAGITSGIMQRITTNPQSLGKFAAPLMRAAQSGGEQAIAATHYVLSHQYPEYNSMFMGDESNEHGQ